MNYASRAHHGVTGAIVPAMIVLLLPYRPLEWTRRCPGVVDKTTGKDKRAGRLALKSTETPGIVIKSIIQRSFPFVPFEAVPFRDFPNGRYLYFVINKSEDLMLPG